MPAAPALRMTLNPPTEQEEQEALFKQIMSLESKYPELAFVLHIPNGAFLGANRQRYGRLLVNLGVRPGVPDIFCPIPRGSRAGLWIELKRLKYSPSNVKPEQRAWHTRLLHQGYAVAVCAGWIEAWNAIVDYLGLEGEEID